jgi:hypothetical protein
VPRKGDKAEQKVNIEIGMVIAKPLSDFDQMNDSEVNSFRKSISAISQEAVTARMRGGERQRELYHFPPRIDETPFPSHLRAKLPEDLSIFIKVRIPKMADSADDEMEFR